ncbi:MAG: 5-formyltetrahydrofolate cyclo-ligase [Zetaproteobacteria bacterium CG12_big_fil_rev_8_21_14_0_65_54_13]|nr:MAG: 5-formyltetrahydrofolate cyclo-ligase [Zetaproteobacteria bacterium CG23_combo_of_CG06-09_8_20_14_all_54_7]PIW50796.1 MAG: 5-formyltetrahydrofolate cyclo-ligase [Zetaproteobacteria bacterium CG12_big_fil_rev_8_21_14_0_65_54_13]PIX55293.1 MAG: 5-formyltetrahydrofolate cyclo-ligase [Zetaproteobacteria bacterium CG_4_10_14_3_um_filter_54_28]PJA26867.1 MAG: 5-formyltetrahydrofolate cyclo-ligase [Zetaproteobacteria bacterium CG_4_9_14_3_um_filter_54_145]
MTAPVINKSALRLTAQSARQHLGYALRSQYSQAAGQRLISLLDSLMPSNVLAYRSLSNEVDTATLFQQSSARLFAPVTHHHEHMEWRQVSGDTVWQKGVFGVDEPEAGTLWSKASGLTVLVCPLVAFDRRGNRLGMGKGCFDFWLAEHRGALDRVIGLAFSCQEVPEVPAEGHDVPMDCIITEKEVINV